MRADKLQPTKEIQRQIQCPLCHEYVDDNLRSHILDLHGEEEFRKALLADKERGMPDPEIGERYGISFGTLEQIITEAYGANISILKRNKQIKRWQPPNFHEETTTVWSFKQRGDWATHDGRYRGNWSPYIPRNVILKYSKPGDIILDYFVGSGTTAVEAKLLGRRCIARDINPGAVGITVENLRFSPEHQFFVTEAFPTYEPKVSVGDARDLFDISNNSIDLICAHPPYAGIIKYSTKIPGDLSELSVQDFLIEMRKVAEESLRVLKPGGKCAILIGDARKSKHVVPIGFKTIRVFLDAGFILRELVIKRQHNCKTTGFWYTRSIHHNFLLLAHEYLPIFEKPFAECVREQRILWDYTLPHQITLNKVRKIEEENLETTTVWIFPKNQVEDEVTRNLLRRFAVSDDGFIDVQFNNIKQPFSLAPTQNISLLYIHSLVHWTEETFQGYRKTIKKIVEQAGDLLATGSFLVLEARDFRCSSGLLPAGLFLWEDMKHQEKFLLKEIVVVVPEGLPYNGYNEYLDIVHRYLLIYSKKGK
ncbi:MAG: DNA methyltransferase, partial [Candidatus Jordarchaeum sp.]|uniref:DNA methyltransferase n=1 Tax=Candidatus Jordarchaeum sp. TaxID=2823881 RepID=UPI00404A207E